LIAPIVARQTNDLSPQKSIFLSVLSIGGSDTIVPFFAFKRRTEASLKKQIGPFFAFYEDIVRSKDLNHVWFVAFRQFRTLSVISSCGQHTSPAMPDHINPYEHNLICF